MFTFTEFYCFADKNVSVQKHQRAENILLQDTEKVGNNISDIIYN